MSDTPEITPPPHTTAQDPGNRPAAACRRAKGKIPSLPKEQRDMINRLLLDGATYAVVADQMSGQGIHLNAENISNWHKTGFQDYIAGLERLDYQRARYEAATDLLQETDTSKLPEAGIQTAAAQIYDLLGRLTPAVLADKMAEDPDKYTRLLNALARLARETLALQKNREASAKARAALRELKDPKRKLSDSERRAIVLQVDEILGLGSEDDGSDAPAEPTAPPAPALQPVRPGLAEGGPIRRSLGEGGSPQSPDPVQSSEFKVQSLETPESPPFSTTA